MNIKRIGKKVNLVVSDQEDGFITIPGIKFSEISHTDMAGMPVSPWSDTFTLVGSVSEGAPLDDILDMIGDYMLVA